MAYATEDIAQSLKKARENKGLSQRDLSTLSGVPQSHISKIESNNVDLRLSSLATLAHALDLELELVPRITVPAVRSIVRNVSTPKHLNPDFKRELNQARHTLINLPKEQKQGSTYLALLQQFREMEKAQRTLQNSQQTPQSNKTLALIKRQTMTLTTFRGKIDRLLEKPHEPLEYENALQETLWKLDRQTEDLKTRLMYDINSFGDESSPKPAYLLDGDGDD